MLTVISGFISIHFTGFISFPVSLLYLSIGVFWDHLPNKLLELKCFLQSASGRIQSKTQGNPAKVSNITLIGAVSIVNKQIKMFSFTQ